MHARPREGRDSDPRWLAAAPSSRVTQVLGKSIVLVEDEDEMRLMLERYLTRAGWRPASFARVSEAVAWLGLSLADGSLARLPALIVSDVRLPELSGLDLLEILACSTRKIPTILITAFPTSELRESALQRGAARVLEKPFDVPSLLGAIDSVLGSAPSGEPGSDA